MTVRLTFYRRFPVNTIRGYSIDTHGKPAKSIFRFVDLWARNHNAMPHEPVDSAVTNSNEIPWNISGFFIQSEPRYHSEIGREAGSQALTDKLGWCMGTNVSPDNDLSAAQLSNNALLCGGWVLWVSINWLLLSLIDQNSKHSVHDYTMVHYSSKRVLKSAHSPRFVFFGFFEIRFLETSWALQANFAFAHLYPIYEWKICPSIAESVLGERLWVWIGKETI